MPDSAEVKPPPKDDASDDFWYDSGPESFGGSDEGSFGGSDAEMTYGKVSLYLSNYYSETHNFIQMRTMVPRRIPKMMTSKRTRLKTTPRESQLPLTSKSLASMLRTALEQRPHVQHNSFSIRGNLYYRTFSK
jgi:hypothetical protein